VLDLSTVGDRPFTIPRDLPVLEAGIGRVNAAMVVVDPFFAAIGAETETHSDASIRRALTPLKQVAERTGAAVVCVRHWGKGDTQKAAKRGGGSVAITAAARMVWSFLADPDDPETLLMARAKGNLAHKPAGVRFRLEDRNGSPVVRYLGVETRHADDILERKKNESTEAAIAWLRQTLRTGPMSSDDIKTRGREAGFNPNVLFAAKAEAGIRARKNGMTGGWAWELPPEEMLP
jgi:hypothetical protein